MRRTRSLLIEDETMLLNNFDAYISRCYADIPIGEIYGIQRGEKYYLLQKKEPRHISILYRECLCFKVDLQGNLYYWYERPLETRVMTFIAPLFMLIGGCLLGGILLHIPEMYIWGVIALVLLVCNFFHSSKMRSALLDELMRIIEQSTRPQRKYL